MNPLPPNDADELSQSYQALIQRASWELDVPSGEAEKRRHGDTENVMLSASPRLRVSASATTRAADPSPPPSPTRIIEALLFVGGRPLTPESAIEVIRGLTPPLFQEAIEDLNHAYRDQGRPYHVEKRDAGYVLALRPGYRFLANKVFGGMREARLTQQAIDVLAIVAYRQPVTKQEVDSVRGHESGPILRQLVRRGLIAVASRAESGGREVQYDTTRRFLDLFGLKSLDELPQTEELQKI